MLELSNSLFPEFEGWFPTFPEASRERTLMKTNVATKDGKVEVEIALPGFKKDEVEITLYDGKITVTAEKKSEPEDDKDKKYFLKEMSYTKCSRTFSVGKNITEADIHASFADGILKITLPGKKEKELPETKKIEIA